MNRKQEMSLALRGVLLCTFNLLWACEAGPAGVFGLSARSVAGDHLRNSTGDRPSSTTRCSPLGWFVDATRRRRNGWSNCQSLIEPVDSHGLTQSLKKANMIDANLDMILGIRRSLQAGLATSVGAVIVILSPRQAISNHYMAFVLSMAAGVMGSATLLEFWLPLVTSNNLAQDLANMVLYSSLGAALFTLLSFFVGSGRSDEVDIEKAAEGRGSETDARHFDALRSGMVLMVTLTLHNIPEGFAVGMSSFGSQQQNFAVMIAIAMHNIPEGIAIAAPILAATGSWRKAFSMTVLSGLAEPAGASLAWLFMHTIGVVSQASIEKVLCAVGGMMVAVAIMELIPEAMQLARARVCAGGLAAGCLIMSATIAAGA